MISPDYLRADIFSIAILRFVITLSELFTSVKQYLLLFYSYLAYTIVRNGIYQTELLRNEVNIGAARFITFGIHCFGIM
jgi:hypothetical protein